ncbi:MAG: hypothetical protein K0S42_3592 [Microvirga sp.]|nr:hypothetical protein [Microvirga sp.]
MSTLEEQTLTRPASSTREAGRASGLTWTDVLVALLVFTTFATFRRREIWELWTAAGFDAEVKLKIAAWLVLGGVAALSWRSINHNSHLLLQAPLGFYVLYWLLATISTVYSTSPAMTLFRASQLGILIALVVAAADRVDRWPTLAVIYLGLNWAFLLVGLTGHPASLDWRVLPAYQEGGYDSDQATWRFGTPAGHFSQISIVAAMAAVAVAARMRRSPTVGLLLVLALRGMLGLAALAGTALTSALLALPHTAGTILSFLQRGQSPEELASLNNRISIYDSAMDIVSGHWILGEGYRATRAVVLDLHDDGVGVSHAHNAVLEAAAGLGVGGALLASLLLLSLLVCAVGLLRPRPSLGRESSARRRGVEFTAMFAPVVAFSMLDSSFSLEVSPFIAFFVAVLTDMARERARVSSHRERIAGAEAGSAQARGYGLGGLPLLARR